MPEIIKVYRQRLPVLRLIGKRYEDGDRDADGGYGSKWDEWLKPALPTTGQGGSSASKLAAGGATSSMCRW